MTVVREFRPSDSTAVRGMMQRLAHQRRESTHHLILKDEYARFFPAYLESFLKDPDSVMRVAEKDGQVVGYVIATRSREAQFYKYSRMARLSDVFVEEKHRNEGVAHGLLASIEEWARKAGLQALEVDVFPEHEEEIRALAGLGFLQYRIKYLRPLESATASAPTGPAAKRA